MYGRVEKSHLYGTRRDEVYILRVRMRAIATGNVLEELYLVRLRVAFRVTRTNKLGFEFVEDTGLA